MRASIEPQLRRFFDAALTPDNQQLAPHIAVTARNMVHKAASEYQFKTKPVTIASAATKMNLASVDKQIATTIRRAVGMTVALPKPDITHEPIYEQALLPRHARDAVSVVPTLPAGAARRGVRRLASEAEGIRPRIAYGASESVRATAQEQIANNVALIRSIPEEYFARVAEDVYDNIAEAKRWETLAARLMDVVRYDGEITQSRANLIARDQTSKMTAAFNEERQTSVGITHYEWQTAGDERVRPTHADNDGKVFAWDEPPEETGHPGHDVACRCVAIAVAGEVAG